MTTLTFSATAVGSPDNWSLGAGASKVAAIAKPDDDATSYIDSSTSNGTVQTFTCSPAIPSGAETTQVVIRVRAKRGGGSNAGFVVGYSFTPQGGGSQSGESGTLNSTVSWGDFTYTHSGLSVAFGSGFQFYLRNTQARAVYVTSVEVEVTYSYAVLEIAPTGGAAVGAGGSPTVWNQHLIIPVVAGNDDAREQVVDGEMSLIHTSIVANVNTRSGIIFRNILVPPDAEVSAATVQVRPEADYGDSPGLTIGGQINPADFTTTNYDISGRTLAAAGVNWTASDIGYGVYKDSPDISAILTEIFADAGWAAGGDVGVFLTDNGTGGHLFVNSFNFSGGAYPPRLVIVWAFGNAGPRPTGGVAEATGGVAEVQRGQVSLEPIGAAAEASGGAAEVQRGQVSLGPAGGTAEASGGAAVVERGQVSLGLAGGAVEAAGGVAEVQRGQVSLGPAGGTAEASGGAATVTQALILYPTGGAAEAASGVADVQRGQVAVTPAGGAAEAAGGVARLGVTIMPAGGAAEAAGGVADIERGQAVIAPAGSAAVAAAGAHRLWNLRVIAAITEAARENSNGVMFLDDPAININSNGWAAFQTAALGIPGEPGISVQDARLWLWPTTSAADEPRLTLACELAVWPAALAGNKENISSRTPTPAQAQWRAENIGAGAHRPSANFAPSVKQLIDLPGWSAEAGLMALLHDDGSGGWLRCYSDDAGIIYRPYVVVDWGFGALSQTIEPAGGAVEAAAGAAVVERGQVVIEPVGAAAEAAGGAAVVERGQVVIEPVGAAAEAAGGAAVVESGQVVISPAGGAADAAGGGAVVSIAWLVLPAGGAAEVSSGAAVVERGQAAISPAGGAAAAVGGGVVVLAAQFVIAAGGMAEAAGGGVVVERGQAAISPAGAAAEGAGGEAVVALIIAPAGGTAEGAGGEAVVALIIATAGGTAEAAGGGAVMVLGAAVIAPAGGEATGVIGAADLVQTRMVRPAGGAVEVAGGAGALVAGERIISPQSGIMAALIGVALVALLRQSSPLTIRPRGNGLSVDARDNELSIRPRDNRLTLEEDR